VCQRCFSPVRNRGEKADAHEREQEGIGGVSPEQAGIGNIFGVSPAFRSQLSGFSEHRKPPKSTWWVFLLIVDLEKSEAWSTSVHS
jgi:hypothetical protein